MMSPIWVLAPSPVIRSRATTLTDAVLMHGGEGQSSRDAFDALSDQKKIAVLAFLRSLRTPRNEHDNGRTRALRQQLRDVLPPRRNP